MPTPDEAREPFEPADSRERAITRDRVVTFLALVAISLVSGAVAIWFTLEALAGSLSPAQMFELIPVWLVSAGAIFYLLWRWVRFARKSRRFSARRK